MQSCFSIFTPVMPFILLLAYMLPQFVNVYAFLFSVFRLLLRNDPNFALTVGSKKVPFESLRKILGIVGAGVSGWLIIAFLRDLISGVYYEVETSSKLSYGNCNVIETSMILFFTLLGPFIAAAVAVLVFRKIYHKKTKTI